MTTLATVLVFTATAAASWLRSPPVSSPRAAISLAAPQQLADAPQQPSSLDQVADDFGAALAAAWTGSSSVELSRLAQVVRADAEVVTPVWKCSQRAEYESEIAGAREFFSALSPPAFTVLSRRQLRDGRVKVAWMLGVEWPAVWRPRINILGESTLTIDASASAAGAPSVRRVEERWHQSSSNAFKLQLLPKLRDVFSLYATPTAEHVPMPIVGDGNGYELRRLPPMLALQAGTRHCQKDRL